MSRLVGSGEYLQRRRRPREGLPTGEGGAVEPCLRPVLKIHLLARLDMLEAFTPDSGRDVVLRSNDLLASESEDVVSLWISMAMKPVARSF